MRMRKLNDETISSICKGDVVKFKFQSGSTSIGVVRDVEHSAVNCAVIRLNQEGGRYSNITKSQFDEGSITFAILKKHSPIACYKGEWDFVSNHK